MAQSSKRTRKYLERDLKERGVPLHNERLGGLSHQLVQKVMLQPILQTKTPDDVDPCKASGLGVYPSFPITPVGEWTLNLAGLTRVNVAGLVIYLMGFCNWKDNVIIASIQVDFLEGDTISGLGAS